MSKTLLIFVALCFIFKASTITPRHFSIHSQNRTTPIYSFVPISGTNLTFDIRAKDEARLALTTGPALVGPYYEIIISGRDKLMNQVIKDYPGNVVASRIRTHVIEHEFRSFTLFWNNSRIALHGAQAGDEYMVVSYRRSGDTAFNYIGFSSGNSSEATFVFEDYGHQIGY
ncbi:PREDICTED: uncharacterized protein LOC108561996 [Nicrophorus vespilloides]|uniref:Uncharacterized protein LOC108561996 n=1 Tax=Nicrophorus vespilloides TaxID=110193 RepID=A0ABM1MM51_NICVS|nr:PREDICTED: uncharacterized protein LOC108561996 [Nicrophorus vespilloides]